MYVLYVHITGLEYDRMGYPLPPTTSNTHPAEMRYIRVRFGRPLSSNNSAVSGCMLLGDMVNASQTLKYWSWLALSIGLVPVVWPCSMMLLT